MNSQDQKEVIKDLSTPLIADACVRLGLQLRLAPQGVRPLLAGSRIAGRVIPARHYGSVDIFLECMEVAQPGDILVIDNGGRLDEGCIGDLTVLEARACGLAGIIVWGCHRDTSELTEIGFPVFSLGAFPAGPLRLDPREDAALQSVRVGALEVELTDFAYADDDGVLFVAEQHMDEVITMAGAIWQTERQQAAAIKAGKTLREQLRFSDYLAKRKTDPTCTFRQHLRAIGGAIEE